MTLVNRKLIKLNNRGVRNVSTFGSVVGGSMTFIKKLTASSSATLSFVDGASDVVLDDTYKEYIITFKDIHAGTNQVSFTFNLSVDTGSNYNVAKTTTYARAYHYENDTATALGYHTSSDLAQGTGEQILFNGAMSTDNDHCLAGHIHLFNPSSTTFVKHFVSRIVAVSDQDYNYDALIAGYANSTSAVDAVRFKMSDGNIDAGDICLYGIK